jgi:hypothetical protein
MRNENIAVSVLVLFLTGFVLLAPEVGAKPSCPGHPSCGDDGGDGGSGDGAGQFDPNACEGALGNFPAMAFNREVHAKNGRLVATQIVLADSDASCEVTVYEGTEFASEQPSFYYDGQNGIGTLVWFETEGRKNQSDVMMRATFEVDSQHTTVDVNSRSLPLTAESVWSTPSGVGFGVGIDIGLSPDGSKVAFPYEQNFSAGFGSEVAELLVCDLNACNPEVAFRAENTDIGTGLGGTRQLAWGSAGPGLDRLYFLFAEDAPVFRGDLVAIDQDSLGNWSDEPVVVLENAADSSGSEPYRQLWEPESMSLSGGTGDCVVLTSLLDGAGTNRIEIVQIPQDLSAAPYDPVVLDASQVTGHQATWLERSESSCLDARLWLSEQTNDGRLFLVDPQAQSQIPLGITGKAVDSAL